MLEAVAMKAKSASVKYGVPATYPVLDKNSSTVPKTDFNFGKAVRETVVPKNATGY